MSTNVVISLNLSLVFGRCTIKSASNEPHRLSWISRKIKICQFLLIYSLVLMNNNKSIKIHLYVSTFVRPRKLSNMTKVFGNLIWPLSFESCAMCSIVETEFLGTNKLRLYKTFFPFFVKRGTNDFYFFRCFSSLDHYESVV